MLIETPRDPPGKEDEDETDDIGTREKTNLIIRTPCATNREISDERK